VLGTVNLLDVLVTFDRANHRVGFFGADCATYDPHAEHANATAAAWHHAKPTTAAVVPSATALSRPSAYSPASTAVSPSAASLSPPPSGRRATPPLAERLRAMAEEGDAGAAACYMAPSSAIVPPRPSSSSPSPGLLSSLSRLVFRIFGGAWGGGTHGGSSGIDGGADGGDGTVAVKSADVGTGLGSALSNELRTEGWVAQWWLVRNCERVVHNVVSALVPALHAFPGLHSSALPVAAPGTISPSDASTQAIARWSAALLLLLLLLILLRRLLAKVSISLNLQPRPQCRPPSTSLRWRRSATPTYIRPQAAWYGQGLAYSFRLLAPSAAFEPRCSRFGFERRHSAAYEVEDDEEDIEEDAGSVAGSDHCLLSEAERERAPLPRG